MRERLKGGKGWKDGKRREKWRRGEKGREGNIKERMPKIIIVHSLFFFLTSEINSRLFISFII